MPGLTLITSTLPSLPINSSNVSPADWLASVKQQVATQAQLLAANPYLGDRPEVDATDLMQIATLPGFGEQKAKIFLALLGKQFGLEASGWQEAAGDYGRSDVAMSIADVTGPESLVAVREYKQQQKAKNK
mgnify:CR=1 FL=1